MQVSPFLELKQRLLKVHLIRCGSRKHLETAAAGQLGAERQDWKLILTAIDELAGGIRPKWPGSTAPAVGANIAIGHSRSHDRPTGVLHKSTGVDLGVDASVLSNFCWGPAHTHQALSLAV